VWRGRVWGSVQFDVQAGVVALIGKEGGDVRGRQQCVVVGEFR